ncbi:hypothetical protein SDRG_02940 [Saprolegnia diclina VS20]|uniref:Kazal-like domain-containing protein n=1 Tax=Saprolegnia diclina (strain VS20) TaxID=1156394 RepID=T0QZP5_SAPDV|nr:hypothetical protein SDRG_02940 [Saprolegnia diclina VS20]EQC39500.1 hypothetical protein SDRG_02940 [Saprolegnia diclina VS20]|eukprot:XP_008606772.1 hypothetical protein SDRG_02940 [Saprolegnia diclina VS20]
MTEHWFLVFLLTLQMSWVDAVCYSSVVCRNDTSPTRMCSTYGPKAAVFDPTNSTRYGSQCECLYAKCLDRNVQCYAAPIDGQCPVVALEQLNAVGVDAVRPVCGSNGVTYNSYFHLKVARRLDARIQFVASFACPTPCAGDDCPRSYNASQPTYEACARSVRPCNATRAKICATDGVTSPVFFQNECYLAFGQCLNPSLQSTPGNPRCPKSLNTYSASVVPTVVDDQSGATAGIGNGSTNGSGSSVTSGSGFNVSTFGNFSEGSGHTNPPESGGYTYSPEDSALEFQNIVFYVGESLRTDSASEDAPKQPITTPPPVAMSAGRRTAVIIVVLFGCIVYSTVL